MNANDSPTVIISELKETMRRAHFPAEDSIRAHWFSGYAATFFGAQDDCRFARGSITQRAIKEYLGRRGPLTLQHDRAVIIGRAVSLELAPAGLWLQGLLCNEAEDAWPEIQMGRLCGLSINFARDPSGDLKFSQQGDRLVPEVSAILEIAVCGRPSDIHCLITPGKHPPQDLGTIGDEWARLQCRGREKKYLQAVKLLAGK